MFIVCSLKAVKAGKHNYYTEVIARDDYYKDGGESTGYYLGRGAEKLGLSDKEIGFKDQAVRRLFSGESPDGETLRKVSVENRTYKTFEVDPETGQKKEKTKTSSPTLAWDFTFSAPKSVSVLWSQVSDDVREHIEVCQQRAVLAAAAYLEDRVQCRTGAGGANTEKAEAIFAAFQHSASRAYDPQLHTHLVLMNTALRSDGKGGAVDARHLFKEIHTAGAIYRNELEHALKESLRVQTVETKIGKARGFEVEGIPSTLCQQFSQRSQQIKDKLAEMTSSPTSKDVQWAVLSTREKKGVIARDKLFAAWQDFGRESGFRWQTAINQRYRAYSGQDEKDLLGSVSRSLSYRQSITERSVRSAVLSHSHGRLNTKEVESFISRYTASHLARAEISPGEEAAYSLSEAGLKSATAAQSRMSDLRQTLNAIGQTHRRISRQLKNATYKMRQSSFKMHVTWLYATGRMSGRTYRQITTGEGLPKTRLGIEVSYATHRISAKQRDYLLNRIDPAVCKEVQRREAQWQARQEKRDARETRIRELQDKGWISKEAAESIRAGKISLSVAERNIERRGQSKEQQEENVR